MKPGLALGVLVLASELSVMAAAVSTNAPPAVPSFSGGMDYGASIIRLFGALALVIVLIFGAAWMFRNWQRIQFRGGKTPCLNVIEMKHLGQRHALYVVGYREERFLIAASPTNVSLISPLPPESGPASIPSNPASSFADALDRAKGAKS